MGGSDAWNWAALAGLGAFHGLNPAMGWLFAVALGLHRGGARAVGLSLLPLAFGHAAAAALTVAPVLALGMLLDAAALRRVGGLALLGWAGWEAARGHHRPPLHIGMRTGMAGLALWSFLMAAGHGAGLMLLPALLPLCAGAGAGSPAGGAWPIAAAGIAVHTAAMLATIAAVAFAVYAWTGVGFLRRGWINLDRVWLAALALCGAALLLP
jgi:hypothetical protein